MIPDNAGPKRMPLVTSNMKHERKTMPAACMTSWPEAAAFTCINNVKSLFRTLKMF